MRRILHITSGDTAGESLKKSGVCEELLVWHDILYDGPRAPGWPEDLALQARAAFLEETTGGGLSRGEIIETLRAQYGRLENAGDYDMIVLWFDACLFDQSMLSHILACMSIKSVETAELICVDAFPGITPFDGLGQLRPEQLASVYDQRRSVTRDQFCFAERVDKAFAVQDKAEFAALSSLHQAPLPWVPAAVRRWLREQPDEATGLGQLERLALHAVRSGLKTPSEIFRFVAAHDEHPQFWGDSTLWAKINGLASRRPPLLRLEGPKPLLPQWHAGKTLEAFSIYPAY